MKKHEFAQFLVDRHETRKEAAAAVEVGSAADGDDGDESLQRLNGGWRSCLPFWLLRQDLHLTAALVVVCHGVLTVIRPMQSWSKRTFEAAAKHWPMHSRSCARTMRLLTSSVQVRSGRATVHTKGLCLPGSLAMQHRPCRLFECTSFCPASHGREAGCEAFLAERLVNDV